MLRGGKPTPLPPLKRISGVSSFVAMISHCWLVQGKALCRRKSMMQCEHVPHATWPCKLQGSTRRAKIVSNIGLDAA
eukprot:5607684-Amphidinium_carterae.1